MFEAQLEQQTEVTDFLTKFHILMSLLWSLRVYYTQYEINTVVHLWQGAQDFFMVIRYFVFISSYP